MDVQLGYFTSAFQTAFALNALSAYLQSKRMERTRRVGDTLAEITADYLYSELYESLFSVLKQTDEDYQRRLDRLSTITGITIWCVSLFSVASLLFVSFNGEARLSASWMAAWIAAVYLTPLLLCGYWLAKVWIYESRTLDALNDVALKLEARGLHKEGNISVARAVRRINVQLSKARLLNRVISWLRGYRSIKFEINEETSSVIHDLKSRLNQDDEQVVAGAIANMFLLFEMYKDNPDAEIEIRDKDGTLRKRAKIVDVLKNPEILADST